VSDVGNSPGGGGGGGGGGEEVVEKEEGEEEEEDLFVFNDTIKDSVCVRARTRGATQYETYMR
jgi:hypothetical protein